MDGQMDGWTDGQMDGWMDGKVSKSTGALRDANALGYNPQHTAWVADSLS